MYAYLIHAHRAMLTMIVDPSDERAQPALHPNTPKATIREYKCHKGGCGSVRS